jgi:hypothetical protein
MAIVQAQAIFERLTLLPRDRCINTWHFSVASTVPSGAELDDIRTKLSNFYFTATTNLAVARFFSANLISPMTIRYYNMDEPAPRPPIRSDTVIWVPEPSGTSLPSEVAVVMSYRGTPGNMPIKNNRGRIYLGPLREVSGEQSFNDWRPGPGFRQAIQGAGTALIAAGSTGLSAWVVYSPTRKALGLSPVFSLVDDGYVDNAFDTQRRRGLAPTTRDTFT